MAKNSAAADRVLLAKGKRWLDAHNRNENLKLGDGVGGCDAA
jgi:hypothetical protein